MVTLDFTINVEASGRAGSIAGVRAELQNLLPAGWTFSQGSSPVEFVISYKYSEESTVQVSRCISTFSYGHYWVEGRGTARCRVISLLEPSVGVVLLFCCEDHPKKARPFWAKVTYS